MGSVFDNLGNSLNVFGNAALKKWLGDEGLIEKPVTEKPSQLVTPPPAWQRWIVPGAAGLALLIVAVLFLRRK